MDVRTLIKFYVLLGKSGLECCMSFMEGLGTYASLSNCQCVWVPLKNGREEIDDAPRSGASTSVTDECHVEQMKSVP